MSFKARIALRPRNLDESYDLAFAYLRTHAWEFRGVLIAHFVLTAGLCVPTFLLLEMQHAAPIATVIIFVLDRLVTEFSGRHLFGEQPRWRSTVRQTMAHLPALFVMGAFIALPVALIARGDDASAAGAVLLGIPWLLLAARYIYLPEILLLERNSFRMSMRTSAHLSSKRLGRSIAMLLTWLGFRLGFAFTIASLFTFGSEFVLQFEGVPEQLETVASTVGLVVSGPFLALTGLFEYVDARTRREGWDIQVRFLGIARAHRRRNEERLL